MAKMNNYQEDQVEMTKPSEIERQVANAILGVMHNTLQTFVNLDVLDGADRVNMVSNILLNLTAGHMVGAYLHMKDETDDRQKIDKESEVIQAITRFMVGVVAQVKRGISKVPASEH